MRKNEVRKEGHRLLIIFCLIFFITLLLQGSSFPFVGVNAWNFNTYSQIAKNYVMFGYIQTTFAPIVSVSQILPQEPAYYLHHPQLISIGQSLFFKVFSQSFFTARLPVIIASIISAILIYKIAYGFKGKSYATLCLIVAILIPGFSIFGRMIGQEALVLMFALSTSYFFIKYTQKKLLIFKIFAVLSVFLGTLSDWPFTYFVFFFAIFALRTKAARFYVVLFLISLLTALGFLFYVYILSSGFSDLYNAFLVRSPGEVTRLSNWYLNWFATIVLRLTIYLNPLVFAAGILGVGFILRSKKKTGQLFYFIFCLFLFGSFHILLYPEGSFGHAYWIYYLIPFFVFSAAYFVLGIVEQKKLILVAFLISLVYLLLVVNWKTGEARGNIFRYVLAKSISQYLEPYDTVRVNPQSAIDPDLLEYAFSLRTEKGNFSGGKKAIYTCSTNCEALGKIDSSIAKQSIRLDSPDAKGFVYFPNDDQENPNKIIILYKEQDNNRSFASRIYATLMDALRFPQL